MLRSWIACGITFIMLAPWLAGCITRTTRPVDDSYDAVFADLTSGEVGCPPAEIEISDPRRAGHRATWTAACRGTVFYCSGALSGHATHVGCTESRE